MVPIKHTLFGLIFSLILFALFPKISFFGFILIFASSVFIDIDHYIYYVYRKKDFNLKNSFNWFLETGKEHLSFSEQDRKKFYHGIYFLHGLDAIIILIILFLYSKLILFLFVLTGFVFHQSLDSIELNLYKK